jgi:hypothetical protein
MNRDERRDLIERLRDLPPPAVPPGLEAKLLATIKPAVMAPPPTERSRSRWRLPAITAGSAAAVAACIVIAVTVLRPSRSSPLDPNVRPELVVGGADRTQETRPCDILPPLPRSL